MTSQSHATSLRRELGIPGAVITGLGSILGTGVFVSIGIAAGIAGDSVILAIVVAALVAICNGLSSAQLAANHPVSGGTYEYGNRWLTPSLGFLAGWTFLWAKSASAATAALGFSGYLPQLCGVESTVFLVPLSLAGISILTLIVLRGIRRSAQANAIIVGTTLLSLGVFILAGMLSGGASELTWQEIMPSSGSASSFAQAVGLMFVAYTGYGRIATLGEEVKSPRRTIPIAVIVTLGLSMLIYFGVALVSVQTIGAVGLAEATVSGAAPLQTVSQAFSLPGISVLMSVGAITAMLGVLLNLLLGLSRVLFAMGRRGDMPKDLASVSSKTGDPWIATLVMALVISAIASLGSVKLAWSFSAFTVLIYYAITNACALRLKKSERLYPRIFPIIGLISCLFLSFWVDRYVWFIGLGIIVLGLIWHLLAQRLHSSVNNN